MRSALSAQDIEKLAASWLARQDAAALTEAEQAAFDAWLAEDDRHLGAYMRLRAVWARLDRLGALRPSSAEAVIKPSTVFRHWRQAACAAAVAVMLAGGYYGWKRPEAPKTYDTAIGEVRRLAMEDGSVVEMNTNSEVNIAYSDKSRDIYLAHGEGNFTVAKNKSRPFIVHAGDTTVTAVGTAFSVDATRPDQLRVSVSEGTVAVRHGVREPAYVAAMQVLTVPTGEQQREDGPQLVVATAEQIDKRLSWRKGMLVFSGENLAEAAAQFNRYNQRQISVTPRAAAAAARVGGVFQTRDVEGFARATAASFGLTVSQDKNGNMVIDKGG